VVRRAEGEGKTRVREGDNLGHGCDWTRHERRSGDVVLIERLLYERESWFIGWNSKVEG
jgi:hypothetical protein